ncbi:hypothetical protein [Domibacillus sp.]|uniref:hypothetical protein n=1 Tax=Domibacillus sp. TaxID=1969783 RepID=UPI0028110981|nr:hypothetical protein [Domibacillus sp.]
MDGQIGKLEALFGDVDNVVKSTGQKRISVAHIDSLQAHKAVFLRFLKGEAGTHDISGAKWHQEYTVLH